MMEQVIVAFLIGFAVSSSVWISAIRRAKTKPEGRTAKFMAMLAP